MIEDLVEPMKVWISAYRDDTVIIDRYGIDVLKKIKNITEDFFQKDAINIIEMYEDEKLKKAKKDFMSKYPSSCNKIIEFLSNIFLYTFILH